MRKPNGVLAALTAVVALGTVAAVSQVATAQDQSAQTAYRDIEKTLGSPPTSLSDVSRELR